MFLVLLDSNISLEGNSLSCIEKISFLVVTERYII